MNWTDFYPGGGTPAEGLQEVSQPASPANSSSPQTVAPPQIHAAVSWLGIVIALVALRVLYEVSE
jgi:hypothetical protein